jgi:hypothetical protein
MRNFQRLQSILTRYHKVIGFGKNRVLGYSEKRTSSTATIPLQPKGISTRILDYIVDHPWHFFGPLIGAIVLYFVRLNLNSQEQDALIRKIDRESPLHAREVSAIGRANSVTLKEWDGVLEAVSEAIIEQGGKLYLRPTEIKLLIERVIKRPLLLHHMLRRAATLINDKNLEDGDDSPVHVVDLLLLYGSVLGGRPEPPELAPLPKDSPLPPPTLSPTLAHSWPSGALNPWVSISDFEDFPTPSLRLATYIRMLRGFSHFNDTNKSNTTVSSTSINTNISEKFFKIEELAELFDRLGAAHQIPTKSRTGPHSFYPWFKYSLRAGNDAIDEAAKEMKIELLISPDSKEKKDLSIEEARKLFLRSRTICAWGECFD